MITDTMSDTEWQTQHFHRVFLPKANTNASSLCSYLGWKIFTITNDDTMYFSTPTLIKIPPTFSVKGWSSSSRESRPPVSAISTSVTTVTQGW